MEHSDVRFARAVLARGWCDEATIQAVLGEAAQERAEGRPVLVGQVMMRRRLLTAEQFASILGEVAESILRCGSCGTTYRVGDYRPDEPYACRRCACELRPHSSVGLARIDSEIPTLDRTAVHPPRPSAAGRRFGSYTVLATLGRGGMGVVYRARHEVLGREVALKVLEGASADDPHRVDRFLREGQIVSRLVHPHIVRVHEFAQDGDAYFLAMELVEGDSLAHALEQSGHLPRRRAIECVAAIARAVDYAHGQGVVHRDLKPANVLLDASGSPRILDFGLALFVEEEDRLTRTGLPLGTPYYMSPEQCRGDKRRIDHRTDVYSIGVILYEALTGRRPHTARSAVDLLQKIQVEDPIPLSRIDRTIPRPLEAICLRALARDPDRRYPSAAELADDLERFLRGEALPRVTTARRPRPGPARRGRRTSLYAIGGSVAAIGLIALALLAGSPDPAPDPWSAFESALAREDVEVVVERFVAAAASAPAGTELETARRRVAERLEAEFDRRTEQHLLLDASAVLELARRAEIPSDAIDRLRRRGLERAANRIRPLLEAERFDEASAEIDLARRAYGDDDALTELDGWARGSSPLRIETDPPGLEVHVQAIEAGSGRALGEPTRLGATPISGTTLPAGLHEVRIEVPGRPGLAFPVRSESGPGRRPIPIALSIDVASIPETMVYVPAGEFVMGPPSSSRRVQLAAFVVDRTEVTIGEYARLLATIESPYVRWRLTPLIDVYDESLRGKPSEWETLDPARDRRDLPVNYVSFMMAEKYAVRLGRRIPTSEEWEKAARGIDGRAYPWGNAFDPARARVEIPQGAPSEVASYPGGASPYGLLDACGNLREWTWSRAKSGERIVRGGSYKSVAGEARAYDLEEVGVSDASRTIGLRTCRTVLPSTDPESIRAAFASPAAGTRQEAARLAGLSSAAPDLVPRLLDLAISDPVFVVRETAMRSLLPRLDPAWADLLLDAARKREKEARERTARAVAFLVPAARLRDVVELMKEHEDEIGFDLMLALLERRERSAEGLYRSQLVDTALPADVRRRAAVLLADLGDAAARDYLVGLLGSPRMADRYGAAQNLWALGDPACLVPLLEMFTTEGKEKPGGDPAFYLHPFVGRRRGLAELRSALGHENPRVRALAVAFLGLAGDRGSRTRIASLSRSDPDAAVRKEAKEALERLK